MAYIRDLPELFTEIEKIKKERKADPNGTTYRTNCSVGH